MLEMIKNAINNHEELTFSYSGIVRVVQPATVGRSRTGKDVLRCFQTQGGHVNPGHQWDLCELALISNLQGTGRHFAEHPPGYKRGDKHISPIYAEL
nr:hypothetical protein [uncultured Duganella sp.]